MPLPRKMLGDDEEIVVEMRPHWVFFLWPLVAAAVVVALVVTALVAKGTDHTWEWSTYPLIVVAAVPVAWFCGRLLRWRNYIIALTTTRVIVRRGVLDRNTLQVRLQRVTEVNTNQLLWERIIGVGRLILDVQGEDDSVVIEDVAKPLIFQRVINTQIDELTDRHRTDLYAGSGPAVRPRSADVETDRDEDGDDTPPHGLAVIRAGGGGAGSGADSGPRPVAPYDGGGSGGSGAGGGSGSGGSGGSGGSTPDQIRDRLIELDDLRQRGILSEEEFAAKKAELLNRI